jgi:hypothetical protein
VLDDATVEADETVDLTLAAGAGYTVGSPNAATVTIQDDDTGALPVITVTAPDALAGEPATGAARGKFRFNRTGPTTSALTVNYTVAGTATSGSDYGSIGTSITFAIGSAGVNKNVNVLDDAVVEADETVDLTLAAGAGYTVGSPNAATVTIQDDE